MYLGFKPSRGYENDAEALAWAKEANVWAELYLEYNDDNENHMLNSFQNNGLYDASPEDLHARNLDSVREIGLDVVKKYNVELCVDNYVKEIERMDRLKEHGVSEADSEDSLQGDSYSLGE